MESRLVFVTTFPPRECGIATFTTDLTDAIKSQMDDSIEIEICALEEGNQRFDYPKDVKYILDTTQPAQYVEIAKKINKDHQVKAVMIEHEFGLFGGEYGDYLFNMLDILEKPFIITFHSVIPHPHEKMLHTVKTLADKAKNILVMTYASREILIADYNIPEKKIKVVPHGTHLV
ncbi:MAG: glycosyltransferase, partial [Calditrichae bacterium]|nr:glycosyltransferase [Calditrichia bacterium]